MELHTRCSGCHEYRSVVSYNDGTQHPATILQQHQQCRIGGGGVIDGRLNDGVYFSFLAGELTMSTHPSFLSASATPVGFALPLPLGFIHPLTVVVHRKCSHIPRGKMGAAMFVWPTTAAFARVIDHHVQHIRIVVCGERWVLVYVYRLVFSSSYEAKVYRAPHACMPYHLDPWNLYGLDVYCVYCGVYSVSSFSVPDGAREYAFSSGRCLPLPRLPRLIYRFDCSMAILLF